MNTQTIELGSTVEWNSQACGTARTKRGEVIEVVKPGEVPDTKIKDRGSPRLHESYVVRASVIDGSERQKRHTRVYWPLVSNLKAS